MTVEEHPPKEVLWHDGTLAGGIHNSALGVDDLLGFVAARSTPPHFANSIYKSRGSKKRRGSLTDEVYEDGLVLITWSTDHSVDITVPLLHYSKAKHGKEWVEFAYALSP